MAYRYTQLITKSHKRLRALYEKLQIRDREVTSILQNAETYNIALPSHVYESVYEWQKYLRKEKYKINEMINVRFNPLYKGGYGSWAKQGASSPS